jgi:hypothetical protein
LNTLPNNSVTTGLRLSTTNVQDLARSSESLTTKTAQLQSDLVRTAIATPFSTLDFCSISNADVASPVNLGSLDLNYLDYTFFSKARLEHCQNIVKNKSTSTNLFFSPHALTINLK